MRTKHLLILVTLIVIGGCSVHNQLNSESDYMVYGVYCGECIGDCGTMYKLTGNDLFIDSTNRWWQARFKGKKYSFKGDILNKTYFAEAESLKTRIPPALNNSKDKIFGTPDNRDQCGVYVQIKNGKKIRIFDIDTDFDKVPLELQPFANKIIELSRKRLKDLVPP